MAVLLDEIHPGEILLEDFMKPMGITARQLAADIDVSPSRISDLVHGNRPITADTALRLATRSMFAKRRTALLWKSASVSGHLNEWIMRDFVLRCGTCQADRFWR